MEIKREVKYTAWQKDATFKLVATDKTQYTYSAYFEYVPQHDTFYIKNPNTGNDVFLSAKQVQEMLSMKHQAIQDGEVE